MTQLSDLLNRLNRNDWSSRRIEEEAAKLGHQLSYATVSKYLAGTHPANPSAKALSALAAVFKTDVNRLREAVGKAPTNDRFELPAEADMLNPDERRVVVDLVRVMARNKKAGDGNGTPMNEGERGSSTVTDLGGERRRRDDWAFGHRVRGDLGVPPIPEVHAAYEAESEGKARWEEDQARGEESQVPPEDDE